MEGKTEEKIEKLNFDTLCIRAGSEPDEKTGAVCVPISLATTYKQESPGKHKGFEYSRSDNPTRKAIEECIALLEDGNYGFAFASGSACTATVLHLLESGDHLVSCDDIYGGTNRYFSKVSEKNGVKTSFVNFQNYEEVENAISSDTKMLWIESPSNPTLKVIDIPKIMKLKEKHQLIVVVDSTFATPYLQKPLQMGADIVVHSATKYLNGHSDVIMGLAATKSPLLAHKLKFLQNAIGAVPSPFDCYLTLRGVKTLHLRMKRQCENALKIAEYLSTHPSVNKVYYPGLPDANDHDLARRQMRLSGAIVSFELKGGKDKTFLFLEKLKIFTLAESLGCVESLANHPATMTHSAVPIEKREKLGITPSLIRLSVGVEDGSDLISDIERAFKECESE